MTKYSVTRYEGEAQPCAIADPAGCFYMADEVDREIARLEQRFADMIDEACTAMILVSDMIAWFKWTQQYPSPCVQEFIARGGKFAGGST